MSARALGRAAVPRHSITGVRRQAERTMEKHFTLVFLRRGNQVLLGQRKRGFWSMRGKWNGFGGKVEDGEDILKAVFFIFKHTAFLRFCTKIKTTYLLRSTSTYLLPRLFFLGAFWLCSTKNVVKN